MAAHPGTVVAVSIALCSALTGCERKQSPAPAATASMSAPAPCASPSPSAAASAPRFPKLDKAPAPIDKLPFGLGQLQYLPDGNRFLSSGQATPVRIWSVATGAVERVLEPAREDRLQTAAAVLRDGTVMVCKKGELRHYDPLTGELLKVALRPTSCDMTLFSSPDGKYLAWIDSIGMIHLFDLAARTEQKKALGEASTALLGYSPGSDRLCVRSWLHEKPLPRTVPSLELRKPLDDDEPCGLKGFATSPDGKWLVEGRVLHDKRGETGQVLVKPRAGADPEQTLSFHFLGPKWLRFADHGQVLLAIGGNSKQGMIKGWSVADWKELFTVETDGEPMSFDLSPDGSVLLWGGYGGRLRFRDVRTGKELVTIDTCCG